MRAGQEEEADHFAFEQQPRSLQRWMSVGHGRLLSLEEGMLVEYDVASRAPVGVVFLSVGERPPGHFCLARCTDAPRASVVAFSFFSTNAKCSDGPQPCQDVEGDVII
jgi:hypothetical protein